MKPNFALNFTDDSITLLHRTKRGWTEVGSTAFDVDDLPTALADLKAKADAIAPGGITTKLVIPNSQIKYLTIAAPGPDADSRKAQIVAGLEGQTPYDVADLVWDHVGSGDTVQVAVLARETLDEAEGFAAEHGFNPVSFVAIPLDAGFGTEPFFGTSSFAATVLKEGQKVDRDSDPILPPPATAAPTTTEPAPEPLPTPEPEPEPRPEPRPDITPPPLPMPEEPPLSDPRPDTEPLPDTQPTEIPGGLDETTPPPPPEMTAGNAGFDQSIAKANPAAAMEQQSLFSDAPAPSAATAQTTASDTDRINTDRPIDPAAIAATLSAGDPPSTPSVLDSMIPDIEEAPMAIDVGEDTADTPSDARRVIIDPSVDDDLPPMPPAAALSAYSARPLGGDVSRPTPTATEADRSPARGSAKPAADRPTADRPTTDRPAGIRPPPKFSYETPGEKPTTPVAKPTPASKAIRGVSALVTAPSIPGGRKAKVSPPATAASNAAASAAAMAAGTTAKDGQSARRPAGLGSRPMPVRGKPRHLGLILTGILLIMLALAAGLSSFYVSWSGGEDAAAIETASATQSGEAGTADIPAPEDEMLADLQDPADTATEEPATASPDPLTEETPADGVVMTAEDPNAAPAQGTPELTPEPAPATVIAGDPAPANAPANEAQDEIFLSGSDTPPAPVDPVALPAPTVRADLPPQPQQPPPPFGTVYQFDENGLIRPTPEGIATPEGVLLFAGSPPLLPPSRPDSVTAAGVAAAQTAAAPSAEQGAPAPDAAAAAPEPAVIVPSDPALADARPVPRPAGLAPPAPAETAVDDGASLAPEAGSRIASLRPSARPESILAAAVAAGAIAPTTASANGSLALVAPEGTVTPIGLTISRRPAARPQDMNRAVEAAVAAAIRLPDPEPPTAEVTPETEEEPELAAAAAPRIPSTANVAKQATIRNAINLRDMNLIGVYGTSAERYALVRNPNGRYIKVGVGDRLDGGRVAAITASELRYEKRGRMVVLALPNS